MSPLQMKELIFLSLSSLLFVGVTSSPTNFPDGGHSLRRRALNVVKTTETDSQTIDWIPIDSQGPIAELPPPRDPRDEPRALSELEEPGADLGPPGTVPVARVSSDYLAAASNTKALPGMQSRKRQTSNSGLHWYSTSNQTVNNIGGSCIFSLFAPYVQSPNDSSLLQTAVTKQNVLINTRAGPMLLPQTVEAGWINFPSQIQKPHLFTFFTTNGYWYLGDNQGGWNTEVAGVSRSPEHFVPIFTDSANLYGLSGGLRASGAFKIGTAICEWVQVDSKIHPGSVFTPLSIDGGAQHNLKVEYNLHGGNWWLAVEDRWIGYYPGSMFTAATQDPPSTTLAAGSDVIYFYGEIYNSEDALTTTDMGSGEFAAKGLGRAAYIKNITYTNPKNVSTPYNGVFKDDDTTRYTHEAHFLSGTNMGSYAFIGGPGAGGVVGG